LRVYRSWHAWGHVLIKSALKALDFPKFLFGGLARHMPTTLSTSRQISFTLLFV
jgi:hypothetical protein